MDLSTIPNELDERSGCVRAVIETPARGRTKFGYEPKIKAFEVHFLLPEGMSFPLNFGFVPGTRAEDGDPLDILVLADEPLPTGSVVTARLVGAIEAEQSSKEKTVRNDRLVAVSQQTHLFAKVASMDDLGPEFLPQLKSFWINYNKLRGRKFKVLSTRGGPEAARLVRKNAA